MDVIVQKEQGKITLAPWPALLERLRIEKEMVLGREETNAIVVEDASASARHAILGLEGERVYIQDLNSRNGTRVNQVLVGKQYLTKDDVITIAYTDIVFSQEGGQQKEQAAGTQEVFAQHKSLFYLAIRYWERMVAQRSFRMQIHLDSQPISRFPEEVGNEIPSKVFVRDTALLQIKPIFPGCLVSPSFHEVCMPGPCSLDFWVTPLSEDSRVDARVEFWERGVRLHSTKTPFENTSRRAVSLLFALALVLPLLGMILDIVAVPLHRHLPALLFHLISLVRFIGGATCFGILAGCLCLFFSLRLSHSRKAKTSAPIFEEIVRI